MSIVTANGVVDHSDERALVGGLLKEPRLLPEVRASGVTTMHFTDYACGRIWSAMVQCDDAGKRDFDDHALLAMLAAGGKIDRVGAPGIFDVLRAASDFMDVAVATDSVLTADEAERALASGPADRAAHKAQLAHKGGSPDDRPSVSALSTHVRRHVLEPVWPNPIADAALYGIAGEFVRLVAPQSEADPVAILVQLLTAIGALMGRSRFLPIGREHHYAILFALIVGPTGQGKGMSWAECAALINLAAPDFLRRHMSRGLSSGEGIMARLRDGVEPDSPAAAHVVPLEGCFGKRLLVRESEFSTLLKVRERKGNTVTEQIRQMFDGEVLETMTKVDAIRASDVHGALIGHVTPADLQAGLKETEIRNGLINRFLVVAAKSTRDLPHGGTVPDSEMLRLASELRTVLPTATNRLAMRYDTAAMDRYSAAYHDLKHVGETRLGEAAARGRVHVTRLAMIFATLDGTTTVGLAHIEAALAVWTYCRQSLAYALGSDPLSTNASKLLAALESHLDHRLPWLEVRRVVFQGHRTADAIDRAVRELVEARLAWVDTIAETGGRNRRDLVLGHETSLRTCVQSAQTTERDGGDTCTQGVQSIRGVSRRDDHTLVEIGGCGEVNEVATLTSVAGPETVSVTSPAWPALMTEPEIIPVDEAA